MLKQNARGFCQLMLEKCRTRRCGKSTFRPKKLKNTMDQRIDSQRPNLGEQQENLAEKDDQSKPIAFLSEEEMQAVYAKLKLKCLQN